MLERPNFTFVFKFSGITGILEFNQDLLHFFQTTQIQHMLGNFEIVNCMYQNDCFLFIYGRNSAILRDQDSVLMRALIQRFPNTSIENFSYQPQTQNNRNARRTRRPRSIGLAARRIFESVPFAETQIFPLIGEETFFLRAYQASVSGRPQDILVPAPELLVENEGNQEIAELRNQVEILQNEIAQITRQRDEALAQLQELRETPTSAELNNVVDQAVKIETNEPVEIQTEYVLNDVSRTLSEDSPTIISKPVKDLTNGEIDGIKRDYLRYCRVISRNDPEFFNNVLGNRLYEGHEFETPFNVVKDTFCRDSRVNWRETAAEGRRIKRAAKIERGD